MILRTWATPLTIGAFVVMGVTGTLMFFHLDTGLNKPLHEWAGLVMVGAVAAHLLLNWRPFVTYFKRPFAALMMAAGAVVLALSFALPAEGEANGAGGPLGPALAGLGRAPLSALAAVSAEPPEALVARLQAAGYPGATPDQTVGQLAGGNRGAEVRLLNLVLSPAAPRP